MVRLKVRTARSNEIGAFVENLELFDIVPGGEKYMSTHTIRLHRVLRSSSEKVYRAFLAPDALVRWLAKLVESEIPE